MRISILLNNSCYLVESAMCMKSQLSIVYIKAFFNTDCDYSVSILYY